MNDKIRVCYTDECWCTNPESCYILEEMRRDVDMLGQKIEELMK